MTDMQKQNEETPEEMSARIKLTRDISMGTVDAIIALGLALTSEGIIERQVLAANFDMALDQQKQRDGDTRPATQHILKSIRDVFASPVFNGKVN